jgi:hypothetical protein
VIGHASRIAGVVFVAECVKGAHEVVGHELPADRCSVVLDLPWRSRL